MWKVLLCLCLFPSGLSSAVSGLSEVCQKRLDYAEVLYGSPIFVTSAYRSKEHNEAVGGTPHSYHLTGEAVDIRMPPTPGQLAKLIWALTVAEFGGIGVYTTHVHADVRFVEVFWRGN